MAKDVATSSGDDSAEEVADKVTTTRSSRSQHTPKNYKSRTKTKATQEGEEDYEPKGSEHDSDKPEAENEGDDDEAEQYEIESINDAKPGVVKEAPLEMAYFVHWKGYSAADDSWVAETDASGAKDLINKYWKKEGKEGRPVHAEMMNEFRNKKKGRKSASGRKSLTSSAKKERRSASSEDLGNLAAASSPARKKEQSTPSQDKSRSPSPVVKTSTRKRPRESKNDRDDAMDIDQEEPAEESAAKRKIKPRSSIGHINGRNGAKKRKASPEDPEPEPYNSTADLTDPDALAEIMRRTEKRFGNKASWEDLVDEIVTVERPDAKSDLMIHWMATDGSSNISVSKRFGTLAPQRLIAFYESNLKWRHPAENGNS